MTPAVAILAGGRATRLGELCDAVPKALLPVGDRPFIAYQLDLLRQHGVQHVVLCVGYLGEQVENYVGDGAHWGMSVAYSYDGSAPLGTGGAIKAALPLLGESFFVLYGDAYLLVDYQAVFKAFRERDVDGLMTVYENKNRWDRSNVLFLNGLVLQYDKRDPTPSMNHIDYGLGVLAARVFESERWNGSFDLADIYGDLVAGGRMGGFEVTNRFYEIGSAEGLAETRALLASASPTSEARRGATGR